MSRPDAPPSSEEFHFLRRVVETIDALVLVVDMDGRILYFNRACEELTEIDRTAVLGRYVWDLGQGEEEVSTLRRILDQVVRTRQPVHAEGWWPLPDGEKRLIAFTNDVLRDPDGSVRAVIGTGKDVTEERRIAAEIRQANEDLEKKVGARTAALRQTVREFEEADRLLQTIFDHTHMMVAYLDTDLRFVKVNPAYARADQGEPDDFVGKKHFDLYPNAENESIFRRTVETGEPHFALAKPFQYARSPERGTTYWDWSLVPVLDGQKKVAGLIFTLLDVTHRIRAMEELQESEEEMRAALRDKDVLLKEVHHRVKNNLQVVSSLLYLQARQSRDPALREALDESRQRVRSMALVHEMLCRPEQLARVRFRDYAEKLVSQLLSSYPSGARVHVSVQASDVTLDMDAGVACGMIVNELVSNALKHAFGGHEDGHVTVTLREETERFVLEVKDDGIGLPGDFELDGNDSLGLNLVRHAVTQLEGEIRVLAGDGAVFEVTFPRAAGGAG